MSARATFWAWEQPIKSAKKLCLLALANCHNEDTKQCNPSINYIANCTGLDRKTVMKNMVELEEIGLIERVIEEGKSTNYHLKTSTNFGTGESKEEEGSGTKTGTGDIHEKQKSGTNFGTGQQQASSTKNGTTTSTKIGT